MKNTDINHQEKRELTAIKWLIGALFALVIIGLPALGFFRFIMLTTFLTITGCSILWFRTLPKTKQNQIPMMMLGGFIGIIIGASVVLYCVHEQNTECTVSDDTVKIFC
ncbi:hypothetical protein [Pantoea ananatis]|uniref:hypothetical protein n=1 Tax=Pantoea ananas TaxID=553 RepID=UPI001B30B9C0|nr:hypothetical protein [Pantoea ananatis]